MKNERFRPVLTLLIACMGGCLATPRSREEEAEDGCHVAGVLATKGSGARDWEREYPEFGLFSAIVPGSGLVGEALTTSLRAASTTTVNGNVATDKDDADALGAECDGRLSSYSSHLQLALQRSAQQAAIIGHRRSGRCGPTGAGAHLES